MKKIYALLIIALFAFAGCFDDEGSEGSGTLKVTVNTSADIWGYPLIDADNTDKCFRDISNVKKYGYPLVGGNGTQAGGANDSTKDIKNLDVGDRINIVYLYSELGVDAKSYPVLYKGTSSTNNNTVTINKIEPGDYYVVAFYDYRSGGNQENLMNRYDRYAIYTTVANAETGTDNSTPFKDKAALITIDEGTTEITLDIHKNWVLGKPKDLYGVDTDTGRIFLNQTDGDTIPTP